MKSRISKWGNSLAVRIPRGLLAELGLSVGDAVEFTIEDGRLLVTPVSPRYELEELVDRITAENRHTEADWGPPQGAERW